MEEAKNNEDSNELNHQHRPGNRDRHILELKRRQIFERWRVEYIPPLQTEGVQFEATFSKPMMIELTFTEGPSTQPSYTEPSCSRPAFTEPTHIEIPHPQAPLAPDHAL
ncbi:hypothetical protein CK203_102473 [Vitis vinifera]|uniref:Uncharacterized protein n=1 Tax=Vitis vinifera TaxID=29760 RepID=A0A438CIM3_VITVI|nr:hypothetical protein CK203_102473 [Vitis vinifera]